LKLWPSSEGSCYKLEETTRGGERWNLTLLDCPLSVDPPPSRSTLLTAGIKGEPVPTRTLENVGRGLNVIWPPTGGTGEKSESRATVSLKELADNVVPGCNVSWRRSFDGRISPYGRIGQWTKRVVEFLQLVVTGGCADNIVK
jgi:hypothetical protein